MMTPKEKAEELVLRYSKINARHKDSIKCALIAIDEILFVLPYTCNCNDIESSTWFYNKVKQEIEKL